MIEGTYEYGTCKYYPGQTRGKNTLDTICRRKTCYNCISIPCKFEEVEFCSFCGHRGSKNRDKYCDECKLNLPSNFRLAKGNTMDEMLRENTDANWREDGDNEDEDST
jgi:hypothetical protein